MCNFFIKVLEVIIYFMVIDLFGLGLKGWGFSICFMCSIVSCVSRQSLVECPLSSLWKI